ncbi:MAG: hypothetical protein R3B72_01940 [Polyangiaceae bacterium]
MHALVRGALAVAILAALGSEPPPPAPVRALPARAAPIEPAAADPHPQQPLRCPPRSIELAEGDGRACVPLPAASAKLQGGARGARLADTPGALPHLRRQGPVGLIPRLPERPADFFAYQLPIDPVLEVLLPSDRDVGPGAQRLGIELVTDGGTPVSLVELENQIGQPQIALVGQLYGVTVVVRHEVKHGDGTRHYLAFYGNLGRPGPQIVNGARLGPMAVIGFLADARDDAEEDSYLYFETRLEQEGARAVIESGSAHLSDLVKSSVSVAVDPRNLLPRAK